jgi:hypothetical protein
MVLPPAGTGSLKVSNFDQPRSRRLVNIQQLGGSPSSKLNLAERGARPTPSRTVTVLLAIRRMRAEMTVSSAGTSPRNSFVPYRQASPPHARSRSFGAATGGRSYLKTPHEEIIDEIYAVCDRDCPSPAGRCRSDRTRRRVCGRRRSRRLRRSEWGRRRRTTRGGAAGTNGMRMRSAPQAGTSATGARGNTATKAVAPGCAFVNGQRVCR